MLLIFSFCRDNHVYIKRMVNSHWRIYKQNFLAQAPPPAGPNYFVFTYIFTEKHPRWRSMPPKTGPRPPYGKSWIRPCFMNMVWNFYLFLKIRENLRVGIFREGNEMSQHKDSFLFIHKNRWLDFEWILPFLLLVIINMDVLVKGFHPISGLQSFDDVKKLSTIEYNIPQCTMTTRPCWRSCWISVISFLLEFSSYFVFILCSIKWPFCDKFNCRFLCTSTKCERQTKRCFRRGKYQVVTCARTETK